MKKVDSTKLVSMREYARRRGVSVEAVSKAVKKGRISLVKGKIRAAAADKEWAANTNPGQQAAKRTRSVPKHKAKATQAPVIRQADPSVLAYSSARANRESYMAKLAEMEFKKKAGDLVDAGEVKEQWFKLITEAKTRLLAVASKCKARLPNLSAVDVSIIEDLIREALVEVADGNH